MSHFIIFLLKTILNKGIISWILCRLKWDGWIILYLVYFSVWIMILGLRVSQGCQLSWRWSSLSWSLSSSSIVVVGVLGLSFIVIARFLGFGSILYLWGLKCCGVGLHNTGWLLVMSTCFFAWWKTICWARAWMKSKISKKSRVFNIEYNLDL